MTHPAVNTKVELVVEAIEDLAIAAATGSVRPGGYQNVLGARERASEALREFLQPVLRAVTPEERAPQ